MNSAFDEAYTYDSLNQLTGFNRGSGTRTQDFDYDAVGNRDGVTTNGGTPQTYTANKQNEITSISGATTPTYDGNGNMTGDENGKQFVYDAWNRLAVVKNSGGTTLKTYTVDGVGRRVAETASGTTTDLYYSAGWQVLEERVGGNVKASNVWSPVYVDAMIARDRDADNNSGNGLEERLYVQQDANFNVTALVTTGGSVAERFAYDPYGAVTVMDASWNTVGGSSYAWVYGHQGGRLDATSSLHHFRNRDYSPALGRWVNMDPIRHDAGDVNLYRAVGNSVLNSLDPLGLCKVRSRKVVYQGEKTADLDAPFFGQSPFQKLADFALTKHKQADRGRIFDYPRTYTKSGEMRFDNNLFASGWGPAGTILPSRKSLSFGSVLVFVVFEIDESDGPCSLQISERRSEYVMRNTPSAGGSGYFPQWEKDRDANVNPQILAEGNAWLKAADTWDTCHKQSLIYADSPTVMSVNTLLPNLPGGASLAPFARLNSLKHPISVVDAAGRVVSTVTLDMNLAMFPPNPQAGVNGKSEFHWSMRVPELGILDDPTEIGG